MGDMDGWMGKHCGWFESRDQVTDLCHSHVESPSHRELSFEGKPVYAMDMCYIARICCVCAWVCLATNLLLLLSYLHAFTIMHL